MIHHLLSVPNIHHPIYFSSLTFPSSILPSQSSTIQNSLSRIYSPSSIIHHLLSFQTSTILNALSPILTSPLIYFSSLPFPASILPSQSSTIRNSLSRIYSPSSTIHHLLSLPPPSSYLFLFPYFSFLHPALSIIHYPKLTIQDLYPIIHYSPSSICSSTIHYSHSFFLPSLSFMPSLISLRIPLTSFCFKHPPSSSLYLLFQLLLSTLLPFLSLLQTYPLNHPLSRTHYPGPTVHNTLFTIFYLCLHHPIYFSSLTFPSPILPSQSSTIQNSLSRIYSPSFIIHHFLSVPPLSAYLLFFPYSLPRIDSPSSIIHHLLSALPRSTILISLRIPLTSFYFKHPPSSSLYLLFQLLLSTFLPFLSLLQSYPLNHPLSKTHYPGSTVRCPLFTIFYLSFHNPIYFSSLIHYPRSTVHHPLFTIFYLSLHDPLFPFLLSSFPFIHAITYLLVNSTIILLFQTSFIFITLSPLLSSPLVYFSSLLFRFLLPSCPLNHPLSKTQYPGSTVHHPLFTIFYLFQTSTILNTLSPLLTSPLIYFSSLPFPSSILPSQSSTIQNSLSRIYSDNFSRRIFSFPQTGYILD